MHVHNGQNIQKIPTKVEIFKISLQIRIVYVPNKTVYRGKFTKIRVECIHGYSGLKSKTIWVIFKQRGVAKIIFGIFATTLEHFFVGVYKCNNNKQVFFCLKRPSQSFVNV